MWFYSFLKHFYEGFIKTMSNVMITLSTFRTTGPNGLTTFNETFNFEVAGTGSSLSGYNNLTIPSKLNYQLTNP